MDVWRSVRSQLKMMKKQMSVAMDKVIADKTREATDGMMEPGLHILDWYFIAKEILKYIVT